MAEQEDLVAAVLWVAERVDERGFVLPDNVRGLPRTMWNLARKERKEFYGFLRKALEYRKKEEGAGKEAAQARGLEEADIERLQGRLASFMGKRQRVFCEKCWRELVTAGRFTDTSMVVAHNPEMVPKGASG